MTEVNNWPKDKHVSKLIIVFSEASPMFINVEQRFNSSFPTRISSHVIDKRSQTLGVHSPYSRMRHQQGLPRCRSNTGIGNVLVGSFC